jgi:uncharacterized protein (TIGR02246 family)
MNRDDVQAWLDRYVAAWETYDPDAIGELFAEDAEYRYHPADEPTRGRAAIVESWLRPAGDSSRRDAPGTFQARYEAYAADGDRAVAVGESTYWADASRATVDKHYYNGFLLAFDRDGRCTSFTEYFMQPRKHS